MDRIVIIVVAVALAIAAYFFYDRSAGFADKIEQLEVNIEDLNRQEQIAINSSFLSEVSDFTFSKISTQFNYVHEKVGPSVAGVHAWTGVYEYAWVFNYHFGFKIPANWDWQFQNLGNGEISLNVPEISQLNDYEINAEVVKRIKKANGKHSVEMQKEVDKIALQKVKKVESQFLENETIIKSTKRSLEAYFITLFNQANPDSPIHKVTINTVKL